MSANFCQVNNHELGGYRQGSLSPVHVRVVLILKPGINGRWILWERCYYFGILEATCTSSRLNGCGVTLATPE